MVFLKRINFMKIKKHIVLVNSDHFLSQGHSSYKCNDKYLRAPLDCADALPLIIPAMGKDYDLEAILDLASGVLITGAISNVHPSHYDKPESPETEPYDRVRDTLTFALIKLCIKRNIPFLGICRGFQELNVVCGGSLIARLHETPGRFDHRAPEQDDIPTQYAARHAVRLQKGGYLEKIYPMREHLHVNSLHWQGVKTVGQGLFVEALADDGTVEALSLKEGGWGLAVQWHPEFMAKQTPDYMALFYRFKQAMDSYRASWPL